MNVLSKVGNSEHLQEKFLKLWYVSRGKANNHEKNNEGDF